MLISDKPFVIAEIGNNANASVTLCKHLIEQAKLNGADAVKLQKRYPKGLYTKKLYNSPYENENSFGPTYGLHREALEFTESQWIEIVEFAKKTGIMLFSTAFDHESADFLHKLDMPLYKVASGCLKDISLIEHLASFRKPLVISTGGAEWKDVDRVYDLLNPVIGYSGISKQGIRKSIVPFCLLHCVMEYPTSAVNLNLKAIQTMKERYPAVPIGFSDHSIGTYAIPAAYGYGAMIFEKHFTSNKALPGPDHALSIEPHELQELVHTLDRLRQAKGDGAKRFLSCEQKGYYKMGKGVYSSREIKEGSFITRDDLVIKSPADGMEPWEMGRVVGKIALKDIEEEEPITAEVIGHE